MHWQKLKRLGDPLTVTTKTPRDAIIENDYAKIPLGVNAKDVYAIVDIDNSDISKLFWHKNSSGYASTRLKSNRKLVSMHVYLTGMKYIDHIDRDKLNNRVKNFRPLSPADNSRNKGIYKHNTTGYNGVVVYKGKWKAQIKYFGKNISFGVYEDIDDAIGARITAECLLWGYISPSWNIN